MQTKQITYFGQPVLLACDRRCHKAWGISNRPRIELSDDPDNFAWAPDDVLPTAPENPGTEEGGDLKPLDGCFNKWCARECERSVLVQPGEAIVLRDFSRLVYNMPQQCKGESDAET